MGKKEPQSKTTWNLSDLYSSAKSEQIEKDKKLILSQAQKFTKKYKDKINSALLTPELLLKSVKEYESILLKLTKYTNFTSLLYSKNTKSSEIGRLFQESEEYSNKISSTLLWYWLEWQSLNKLSARKILESPKIKPYKHELTHSRVFSDFRLTEAEEKIMNKKSQSSGTAFTRLYDQISSNMKFPLKVSGENLLLSSSELSPYIKSHPERKVREQAVIAHSRGFGEHSSTYSFILNTLLLDKSITDEIRGYKYPEQATFLSYEVNSEIVQNMSRVIYNSYPIVEKFYLKKAKLMKIKKLYEWDRYCDIYKTDENTYSWQEAKDIVLSAFSKFSPEFYKIAKLFFDKSWIDAEMSDGKRPGAFCSYSLPNIHPYILVNFAGKIDDILTLAHELGHGIHAYLSRNNTLLSYYPSTAIAEIASTFAEEIVFEYLLERITDSKVKTNLLANRIQGGFATIFRQRAFFEFEKELHSRRRTQGELSSDEISHLFQSYLQETFGKGLTLTDYHKNGWMPVLHFYHYNFYVFTYCFGSLLSQTLFSLYEHNPDKFLPLYLKALSLGGSQSPIEILKGIGVNPQTKGFWEAGFNIFKEYESKIS